MDGQTSNPGGVYQSALKHMINSGLDLGALQVYSFFDLIADLPTWAVNFEDESSDC
jgi:hypothetical protein